MSSPRPFSWLGTALAAGVINALINAPIGWGMLKPGVVLPLWGMPSIAGDFIIMAFGISFGTTLMVTPQTRKQLLRGSVLPPALSAGWSAAIGRWPRCASP